MFPQIHIDQLGRELILSATPRRIVCLVPSLTELLAYFELDQEVVGITKFCVYPEDWFKDKERVGGTKTIDIEKIRSLNVDLIIGNKEENTKEDIEALMQIAPVWMSDVNSIEDTYHLIASLSSIFNKEELGAQLIKNLQSYFQLHATEGAGKSVLYFIWHNPGFVAGKNTYIDSYLAALGYRNCVPVERYPDANTIGEINPDVVFLSSEPFPFQENHVSHYQSLYPDAEIILVDGERYSWYGVRTLRC